MATITLAAHCLDAEFKALILKDHYVRVIDETNAPWEVVFEGTVEGLADMVSIHFQGA